MQLKNGLGPVLGSPTKLRLLRTLCAAPGRRWTGRELATAARVSTAQAARDLNEFLEVGIVLREVRGKAYGWQVSPRHVLTPGLARLFDLEAHLRDVLIQDIRRLIAGVPLRRAVLFGSMARGDERSDSDVDLFLELVTSRGRSSAASAVEKVRERVWNRFGNPVTALVYTAAETRHLPTPALRQSIEREGIEVRREDPDADGKS